MSESIVECVPNFSEGRDKKIIDEIIKAIESVSGIDVLDIDMGADTNRTFQKAIKNDIIVPCCSA